MGNFFRHNNWNFLIKNHAVRWNFLLSGFDDDHLSDAGF